MARREVTTDALNGLVAALETFVPPLIESGILDAQPFRSAITEKDKRAMVPGGCDECWNEAVELADADELRALAIYRDRFPFCEHP